MAEPRALVRNAADPKQVASAAEKDKDRLERETHELGVILSTKEGRSWYWRKVSDCGVYRNVYNNHGGMMSFTAGRQTVGLELLADVTQSYPKLYLLMQSESIAREANIEEPKPKTEDES